ncbi:MAG: hypothetical protein JSW55_04210 [Chloroflexota bacterium]|nr:MAG: hypothetical protein JSW55_04210 [Chloroflexota bacterium]
MLVDESVNIRRGDFFRQLIADGLKENVDVAQRVFWCAGLTEAPFKLLLEASYYLGHVGLRCT